MLVTPVLRGLLGWDADAAMRSARLAPSLPPVWNRVEARRLRVGGTTIDADIEQTVTTLDVTLRADGPEVDVEVAPLLPVGHSQPRVTVRSGTREREVPSSRGGSPLRPAAKVRVGTARVTVRFEWRGGISVVGPTTNLEPGQRSHLLRVTNVSWDERSRTWAIDVAGEGGAHDLVVHGPALRVLDSPATIVGREQQVNRLRVQLPSADPRAFSSATIRLAPAR
jgi:hypothetical protein